MPSSHNTAALEKTLHHAPHPLNAAGTLAFGGGTCAIITYFAFKYDRLQLENSKVELQRVCDLFDRALDRQDKDIELLVSEIRTHRTKEQTYEPTKL